MNSSFSVIIISYNGKEFLRRSLKALEKSNAVPQEIIVVDDCSSDGTLEMMRSEFPTCMLIRNDKNRGPTYSRNRGAEQAHGEYLVFLDNDILVRPDSIQSMLHFLANHSVIGLVGGKLVSERGTTIFWNMGYRPNFVRATIGWFLGLFITFRLIRTRWFMDLTAQFSFNYWNYDRTIPVDWVIESFNAIPRKIFEQVGGFDEGYFMFFEGLDLSERLRQLGFLTYFVCDAVVDMLEGHAHSPLKRQCLFYSSRLRYYFKHHRLL